jgi:hypothetical protein
MPSTPSPTALRLRAIVFALLSCGASARATDALPDRQCGGGVCRANIDAKLSIAPCLDANLVLAWSQGGKAIALQCMTDAAPMDQPILVFQRRSLNVPDARAVPHGFLVAGDRVRIVDRDTPAGMVRVAHENAKGVSVTRWIAQADIAPDAR